MKKMILLICTVATAMMTNLYGSTPTPEEVEAVKRLIEAIAPDRYPPEEATQAARREAMESHIDKLYETFGRVAVIPELYKVLEEKKWDASYMHAMVKRFRLDALNVLAESNPTILEIVRKVVDASPHGDGWAAEYLTRKGDASDIGRLSDRITALGIRLEDDEYRRRGSLASDTVLMMRVGGTNVMKFSSYRGTAGDEVRLDLIPSVANTGPQAFYVREILRRHWKETLKVPDTFPIRDEGYPYIEKSMEYASKVPDELLTMVVTLDVDGNPVSSVDLSKYGLSMPVITPKPDAAHDPVIPNYYTITFPHETENPAPQPAE